MALPSYSASAPGSLILMGEYAVLHGAPAVVAAIDLRLSVTVRRREDDHIHIHSALGNFTTKRRSIRPTPPFDYLLTALNVLAPSTGVDITVTSTLPWTKGLGSSAAVTIASLRALSALEQHPLSSSQLHEMALAVIHRVQGGGSGSDIAASIHGGIIVYHPSDRSVTSISTQPTLHAFFSGSKTTTTSILQTLKQPHHRRNRAYVDHIHSLCVLSQRAAILAQQGDWADFSGLMNSAQRHLQALEVSTPAIDQIISAIRTQALTINGAKISGAGLGDCVIALGEQLPEHFPHRPLALKIHPNGVLPPC